LKPCGQLQPKAEAQVQEGLVAAASTTTAAATGTATAAVGAAETAVAATAAGTTATAAAIPTTAAATTVAATTTAAAEAAAARGTRFHGTRFVNNNAAAAQRLAVHAGNRGLCFGIAAHFDKAKAFGAAGVAFHHDFGAGDSAKLAKRLLQVFVANRVRQIADVKFVAHEGTPLKHNDKSDGVPKAQQTCKRTAVARETDRSPNLCGFVFRTLILCGGQWDDKPAPSVCGFVKPASTGRRGSFCFRKPCEARHRRFASSALFEQASNKARFSKG
jgi:hypothetical protein